MAYQGNRRHESHDDHQSQQPRARFNKNAFKAQQTTHCEENAFQECASAIPESQEAFTHQPRPMSTRENSPRPSRNDTPRDKKFHAESVPLREFEQMLRDSPWVFDVDSETGSFHQITTAQKAQTDLYYTAYRNGAKYMEAWYRHQVRALNEQVRAAARKAAQDERARCQAELITGDADFDEFSRQVRAQDWFYQYSDDGAVFRRGADNQERLESIAKTKGGIYQKYWEYYPTTMNKKEG